MSDCRNPVYCESDDTIDVDVPSLASSVWVSPSNYLDWGDITGTIDSSALRLNIYISKENVMDVRLENIECGYITIYKHLVLEYPARELVWELLLKLNGNNYRTTVLQIEDSLRNEDVK